MSALTPDEALRSLGIEPDDVRALLARPSGRRHYHVGENIPGYLPESDVVTFTDRREAVSYASRQAREILEDDYELDPEYRRNRRKSGRDGDYWVVGDGHDLGIHIWTVECHELDCEDEL